MPYHSSADPQRCQENGFKGSAPLFLAGLQDGSGWRSPDTDQCSIQPTEGVQRQGTGRLGCAGIGEISC